VYFRVNACNEARSLKLGGGVRNLRDGRVEVEVYGEEEAVDRLIKWLKIGPKQAKVTIIEVTDSCFFTDHPVKEIPFQIWATN